MSSSPNAGAEPLGPLMETMTWPEVAQAAELGYVPVWIVGATEQHGPHLPLWTDTILPLELVKAVARQIRVVIPPPLPYGFKSRALSGGGQGFPGTTSLDGETLIRVVRDVVGELARHGFRQMVVLDWHMENRNFVWEGIDQARLLGRLAGVRVMSIDSPFAGFSEHDLEWLFVDGFDGWAVEHAALVETSLMLALRPDLVRRDLIVDDAAEEHPWYDLIPEPARHIPRSGVLARASQATEAKGERLRDMVVAKLCEALRAEFGVLPHESPKSSAAGETPVSPVATAGTETTR
jgi:creatinine amidohydrolase